MIYHLFSAAIEPVSMIGYIACGLLLPRLFLAIAGGIGWAVLMNLWDSAQQTSRWAVAGSELSIARIAAGVLAAMAAYYAMDAWQNWREGRNADYAPPSPPGPGLRPMPRMAEDPEPPLEPSLDPPAESAPDRDGRR